jgi:hypothetical protein
MNYVERKAMDRTTTKNGKRYFFHNIFPLGFYHRPVIDLPPENWRKEYNQFRPHSSLNYQPPAPETINPKVEILT